MIEKKGKSKMQNEMDKKFLGEQREENENCVEKRPKDIPMDRIGVGMSFKGKMDSLKAFLSEHSEKSEL